MSACEDVVVDAPKQSQAFVFSVEHQKAPASSISAGEKEKKEMIPRMRHPTGRPRQVKAVGEVEDEIDELFFSSSPMLRESPKRASMHCWCGHQKWQSNNKALPKSSIVLQCASGRGIWSRQLGENPQDRVLTRHRLADLLHSRTRHRTPLMGGLFHRWRLALHLLIVTKRYFLTRSCHLNDIIAGGRGHQIAASCKGGIIVSGRSRARRASGYPRRSFLFVSRRFVVIDFCVRAEEKKWTTGYRGAVFFFSENGLTGAIAAIKKDNSEILVHVHGQKPR